MIESLCLYLLCLSAALLCYIGFQNYSLIRSTSCSCSTCCFGLGFQLQNLQDFIKISRALIKDIFLALQVLHTLQWHHPAWRALQQLAQAPTQDYHFYTHALLGGGEEEETSPSSSALRWQENTELLSFCGLTGTPQRVSLLGLEGKGCSFGLHSVNVGDVGLRLLSWLSRSLLFV